MKILSTFLVALVLMVALTSCRLGGPDPVAVDTTGPTGTGDTTASDPVSDPPPAAPIVKYRVYRGTSTTK